MKLPSEPVTLDEFKALVDLYKKNECEKRDGHLVHKGCGGEICVGFANLFYMNPDGSLDLGGDGFGMGREPIPFCERCDPPDGAEHAYTHRVPIERDVSASLTES